MCISSTEMCLARVLRAQSATKFDRIQIQQIPLLEEVQDLAQVALPMDPDQPVPSSSYILRFYAILNSFLPLFSFPPSVQTNQALLARFSQQFCRQSWFRP
jgi:hypothetical protein